APWPTTCPSRGSSSSRPTPPVPRPWPGGPPSRTASWTRSWPPPAPGGPPTGSPAAPTSPPSRRSSPSRSPPATPTPSPACAVPSSPTSTSCSPGCGRVGTGSVPDMSDDLPDRVTTDLRDDSVIATTTVDATPAEVFDFLRQPANHSIISGDGSVTGATSGPDRLSMGDRFGMSMKIVLPYRMRNTAVDNEQDRRIGTCHPGTHHWL